MQVNEDKNIGSTVEDGKTEQGVMPQETIDAQRAELNPVSQVYFRAGLIACREYMARFVEVQNPEIAASIRANWWPRLGEDLGPPRKLLWNELTEGEYGTPEFRCRTREEVSPTLEALPVALAFLENADESAKRPISDDQQPSQASSTDTETEIPRPKIGQSVVWLQQRRWGGKQNVPAKYLHGVGKASARIEVDGGEEKTVRLSSLRWEQS